MGIREWEDLPEVSGGILRTNGIPHMVRKNSSLVIDGFCDQAKNENIALVCFYCNYLSQQETTVTNMIGAILAQLGGRGKIPKYLSEAFEEGKKEIGLARATPRCYENTDDRNFIATLNFYLYPHPRSGPAEAFARPSIVAQRYCYGVSYHANITEGETPYEARYPKIFYQGGCDTHQSQRQRY